MARRRKKSGGAASGGRNAIKTPRTLMLTALIFTAAGAVYYGLGGLLFAGQLKYGLLAWLGAGLLRGLVGAALGAGFVGVCALVGGVKLGPRYSYPFALSLFGGLGELTAVLLEHFGVYTYAESFWTIGITELILASVVAEVMSSDISGYAKRSRSWGSVCALAVLLAGTSLFYWNSGQQSFSWWFVVKSLSYAAYGGALGAIGGAIKSAR